MMKSCYLYEVIRYVLSVYYHANSIISHSHNQITYLRLEFFCIVYKRKNDFFKYKLQFRRTLFNFWHKKRSLVLVFDNPKGNHLILLRVYLDGKLFFKKEFL